MRPAHAGHMRRAARRLWCLMSSLPFLECLADQPRDGLVVEPPRRYRLARLVSLAGDFAGTDPVDRDVEDGRDPDQRAGALRAPQAATQHLGPDVAVIAARPAVVELGVVRDVGAIARVRQRLHQIVTSTTGVIRPTKCGSPFWGRLYRAQVTVLTVPAMPPL